MKIRSTTQLTTAVLFGIAMLLPALSASASQQAVVQITYVNAFSPGFGTTGVPRVGTGTAILKPTTQKTGLQWNAGIVAGASSFTVETPYLPFLSSMAAFRNEAGALFAGHPGAAATGGSTVAAPSATTKCFASIAPFAPGPPALPGSCFPRKGTLMRAPGSSKYGGTARLLLDTDSVGTALAFAPPGLDFFALKIFQSQTPNVTGFSTVPGAYGILGSGTFTNTVLMTARKTMNHQTQAPWTTGMVTVAGGDFGTAFTLTGSNSVDQTNLTGMISVVRPAATNQFSRNQAGAYLGNTVGLVLVNRVSLTFLPEPGSMLLLGCGGLGLAGLAALRRR